MVLWLALTFHQLQGFLENGVVHPDENSGRFAPREAAGTAISRARSFMMSTSEFGSRAEEVAMQDMSLVQVELTSDEFVELTRQQILWRFEAWRISLLRTTQGRGPQREKVSFCVGLAMVCDSRSSAVLNDGVVLPWSHACDCARVCPSIVPGSSLSLTQVLRWRRRKWKHMLRYSVSGNAGICRVIVWIVWPRELLKKYVSVWRRPGGGEHDCGVSILWAVCTYQTIRQNVLIQ